MPKGFLNRTGFRAVSSGDASFVVASALTGMQTPAQAAGPAVVDGATYNYFAESDDRTQWEYGEGVYTTGDTTLTRETILDNSSGGTTALSFSAAPKVFMGGPQANEVAFRGYEELIAVGESPSLTFDENVLISYVTSNGLGEAISVGFPSLDVSAVSLRHIVIFKTQADPSDTITMTENQDSITLTAEEAFCVWVYRPGSSGWQLWSFGGSVSDGPPRGILVRDLGGNSSFVQPDPNDINTGTNVALGSNPTIDPFAGYSHVVESAGSEGTEPFSIDSAEVSGHRAMISFFFSHPDDRPTLSASNIINDDGSTPSSIIFDDTNQSILLEWQRWRDSDNGKWVIIGASTGVVS